MKKKTVRQLRLTSETVRVLRNPDLTNVSGGISNACLKQSAAHPLTCGMSCGCEE